MSDVVLLTSLEGGVLTITLNRPASRNALSPELVGALRETLVRVAEDDAIRVVVLTGSDPAFCAGLDLRHYAAADSRRDEVGALIESIAEVPKPVIAAVNGPAMTGGLELVLGADFALASERARFGDTHLKIGAMSGSGMNSRLPRATGLRWAKQLVFCGQPIDAATALRIGLVNEVLPHEELLARAQALAHEISARDPELTRIVKDTLDRGALGTLADARRVEIAALALRKAAHPSNWLAGSRPDDQSFVTAQTSATSVER